MEIFVETTLDGFEARMFLFEPGTQRAQQSGDFIPFRWSTFIFFSSHNSKLCDSRWKQNEMPHGKASAKCANNLLQGRQKR